MSDHCPPQGQAAHDALGSAGQRNARGIRLAVVHGPNVGKRVSVTDATLRIGTAADNTLVLSDPAVSAHHCEIALKHGRLHVRDRDSVSGTYWGSTQVCDAAFSGPVYLRLGNTMIFVEPTAAGGEEGTHRFGDIIGRSQPMRDMFVDLARVAGSELTILIEGETGTGKELVAQAIHAASPRAKGPFYVFDCSGVAEALADSELFGHEPGAFTGANRSHVGAFEAADGGTLFLDELGELPLSLQPKLLRALESRTIRRLGSTQARTVDIRVVAATNRNLYDEVKRGNFREDLYFRIAAARVQVPALRERLLDLEVLVAHLAEVENVVGSDLCISEETWRSLRAHDWPGNVRELRNVVRIISANRSLAEERLFELSALRETEAPLLPLRVARLEAATRFERDYLERLMACASRDVQRAAELAGVSVRMIQKLLRKHGPQG